MNPETDTRETSPVDDAPRLSDKKCLRMAGIENVYDDPEPYVAVGPLTAIPRASGAWSLTADPSVRWKGEYGPAEREPWQRAYRRMSAVNYTVMVIGILAAAVAAVYIVLQLFAFGGPADLVTIGVQGVVLGGSALALWAGYTTARDNAEGRRRLTRAGVDDVADTISRDRRMPTVPARDAAAVVMMYREGLVERAMTLIDALEVPAHVLGTDEPSAARQYATRDVEAWWDFVADREQAAREEREAAAAAARAREEDEWRRRLADS